MLLHLFARRDPPTVVFPATRYLQESTRQHLRRLTLQHWLLLLVRTLLIVVLVLAAAGPTRPRAGVIGHAPTALVIVLDNSLSSGAVSAGVPVLTALRAAAREVLAAARPDDDLWLFTADGVPHRGDAAALSLLVDSLEPSPRRLDLGVAVSRAREILAASPKLGGVLVVSDLQASAVSQILGSGPLVVARPEDPAIANVGIAGLSAGPQPWLADGGGGRVTVLGTGTAGKSAPITVRVADRPPKQQLLSSGGSATVSVSTPPVGWWILRAELDPDELRGDDIWVSVVRVAPPARAAWSDADKYLAAAAEVLATNRRLVRGSEITVGALGTGASVVFPPADAASLGALNRGLEARGSAWRFGSLVGSSALTDSGGVVGGGRERVTKRYQLIPAGSGRTGVLATVGGDPWIVRSGRIVLVGSRMEPEWTSLPVSARFMSFIDAVVNRLARGEVALLDGRPGEAVLLPDLVTAVSVNGKTTMIEGGSAYRPYQLGVHFLLAGRDTVGALSVNPDPRESNLERASDATIRDAWHGAEIVTPARAVQSAFAVGARGDLRGPLLWLALMFGLAEIGLASSRRRAA